MAITKERLQELIEQGATVFSIAPSRVINGKPMNIKLSDKCEIHNGKLYVGSWKDCGDYSMLYLYEHRADAEWELEFGNVEKRIKFVKPKPFNELGKGSIFLYKNHDFDMKLNIYQCKENGGRLDVYYKDEFIYGSTFNEENYTEACRLIKKLFMGEA